MRLCGAVAVANDEIEPAPELVIEGRYGDGRMIEVEDVDEAELEGS